MNNAGLIGAFPISTSDARAAAREEKWKEIEEMFIEECLTE